jgi:CRP/FNR family transcriptional regulator, cyclic AMP receptor protein
MRVRPQDPGLPHCAWPEPRKLALDITPLVLAVEALPDDDAFKARLSAQQWQQLAAVLERRQLEPGDLLMRRGDVEARAYFVESGRLQVFVTGGPPHSHRMAMLGAGALLGEPVLFSPAPRMAHVEAVSSAVLWSLAAHRLHDLAAHAPLLVVEVLRAAGGVMAARMRANLERGIPVA